MSEYSYEVHLTSDATGSVGVEPPVRTDRLDFYDSGVWAHTADGRDFFPYEHVQVIRERPSGAFDGETRSGDVADEAAGGSASAHETIEE
jgi:hypothetical protein